MAPYNLRKRPQPSMKALLNQESVADGASIGAKRSNRAQAEKCSPTLALVIPSKPVGTAGKRKFNPEEMSEPANRKPSPIKCPRINLRLSPQSSGLSINRGSRRSFLIIRKSSMTTIQNSAPSNPRIVLRLGPQLLDTSDTPKASDSRAGNDKSSENHSVGLPTWNDATDELAPTSTEKRAGMLGHYLTQFMGGKTIPKKRDVFVPPQQFEDEIIMSGSEDESNAIMGRRKPPTQWTKMYQQARLFEGEKAKTLLRKTTS